MHATSGPFPGPLNTTTDATTARQNDVLAATLVALEGVAWLPVFSEVAGLPRLHRFIARHRLEADTTAHRSTTEILRVVPNRMLRELALGLAPTHPESLHRDLRSVGKETPLVPLRA